MMPLVIGPRSPITPLRLLLPRSGVLSVCSRQRRTDWPASPLQSAPCRAWAGRFFDFLKRALAIVPRGYEGRGCDGSAFHPRTLRQEWESVMRHAAGFLTHEPQASVAAGPALTAPLATGGSQ
jgi:hypothetical protein